MSKLSRIKVIKQVIISIQRNTNKMKVNFSTYRVEAKDKEKAFFKAPRENNCPF